MTTTGRRPRKQKAETKYEMTLVDLLEPLPGDGLAEKVSLVDIANIPTP